MLFTPAVICAARAGFRDDPLRFDLAVELTRITFPYLLLMTLVTLFSGILNSIGKFATAAAAPILLNLTMVATLLTAAFFPTPGHAAAWGVLIAGVLEVLLVGGAALRADVMTTLRRPWPDRDVKRFFKALGPATVGSAGVQLALFADTIIASFLAAGALSALYYADRLYQLPGGVIGIAVGTVLLPEMARRIAAGDANGARARAGACDRVHAAAGDPLRRGVSRRARPDHARAVHAREIHRRRTRRPQRRRLPPTRSGSSRSC